MSRRKFERDKIGEQLHSSCGPFTRVLWLRAPHIAISPSLVAAAPSLGDAERIKRR